MYRFLIFLSIFTVAKGVLPANFYTTMSILDNNWGLGFTGTYGAPEISCNCTNNLCSWKRSNGTEGFICGNNELQWIMFSNLTGTIPEEITELTTIKHIYLQNGQLSGNIPSTMNNLSILLDLYVNNNQLSGTIPILPNSLVELDLSYNSLTGELPSDFDTLVNLTVLNLENNGFAGSINDLNNLPIISINLANNNFSGYIPNNLSWNSLLSLNLQNNSFMGAIPIQITNSSVLSQCNLQNNFLNNCNITLNICIISCKLIYYCTTDPPVPEATCNGNSWIVPGNVHNNQTIVISTEPLIIKGNFTQSGNGVLQITGSGPGIIVTGSVILGGTLNLFPNGTKTLVITGTEINRNFNQINVTPKSCKTVQNTGTSLSVLLQSSCNNGISTKIKIIIIVCTIGGIFILILIGILLYNCRSKLCFHIEKERNQGVVYTT